MSILRTYALPIRVAALIAVVSAPTFLLSLHYADSLRRQELDHIRSEAMTLAKTVAHQQAQSLDRIRSQLARLSATPDLLSDEGCRHRLQNVLSFDPTYFQIALATPTGEIACAVDLPQTAAVRLHDRPYFRDAVTTNGYALSDVLETKITKRWAIMAAQPLMNEGQLKAILVAGLDLAWAQSLISGLRLPEQSIVSMSDRNGRIVARAPEPDRFVGKELREAEAFRTAIQSKPEGYAESAGLDGVSRVIAYSQVPNTSLYVRVGIPTTAIDGAGTAALSAGLVSLVGTILVTALFGWMASRRLVIRPIQQLALAADRLGKGNWSVRTGLAHSGHVMGKLAAKLDELALYGQSITRAFRTLSAGNRTLLREQTEEALLHAMCQVAVDQGGYRLAFVNYIQHDDAKSISTIAHCGDNDGFIESLKLTWSDTERGRGSVGVAVRSNAPCIIRSMADDPRFQPWREEAIRHGFGSIISLPLNVDGSVIGTFTLIAREEDAFDEAEVALLDEMAADLSFGIQIARARVRQEEAEKVAAHVLTHDTLTGLPNRVWFERALSDALVAAKNDHDPMAVIAIHLPRMQEVFDGFGYNASLSMIRQIAERLGAIPETRTVLARTSPSEFAVFVRSESTESTLRIAKSLLAAFQQPMQLGEALIDVYACVGISYFPGHGGDADALLRRAAIAAREGQREAGVYVYKGATERENPERLAMAAELRTAIARKELTLHYQPKINLATGEISGSEALVRWPHPTRGFLPPIKFVPLAEETGLIRPMTNFVIDAAIRQQHLWAQRGACLPVAVNLSANNLYDPRFLDAFQALLETWGVEPSLIDIELTEGALVDDPDTAKRVLDRLGKLGCKIYIDDFGTGYSSLNYLVTLPVHALKIDRSFVQQMGKSREAHSVVASIISMAHNLGLRVVAEGVETEADLELLKSLRCDEAQGYYFSKPVTPEAFSQAHLLPR